MLDSQQFCLPQRRNRIWGIATINTGKQKRKDRGQIFKDALDQMQGSFQFPIELNFEAGPEKALKPGRHTTLVNRALEKSDGCKNLFVDCSSTLKFLAYGEAIAPPITPDHPYYATKLSRYLTPKDCLQAQGLWQSCFDPQVYDEMVRSKLGQDLAGSSFSSTVCMAATLTSFMLASSALGTLRGKQGMKRIRGKQTVATPTTTSIPKKKQHRAKHKYARKVEGKDSRKESSGKSQMASIWDKEKLCLGC